MTDNISTDMPIEGTPLQATRDPDEINLLEYIYAIAKNKWLIIGLTILGIIGGYFLAKKKGPTWVAEVVISLKETDNQKSPNISSFGAFGGLVASQLNISGNATFDKISQLLDSRDFNARLIKKYDLLPLIYRVQWPKQYAEYWDSTAAKWKPEFREPELLGLGGMLKGCFLKTASTKNNTMKLEVRSIDSTLSKTLARHYISFLDEDIRTSVQDDAKENVDFLQKQLITISDPLLREKIQSLIADEIEKTMLVSKEAFKVVDPVFLSCTFKEKRMYPLVFGAGLFILTLIITAFFHAIASAEKTDNDRLLISRIKKELIPWVK